jgi:hypothetical protein
MLFYVVGDRQRDGQIEHVAVDEALFCA